MEIQKVSNDLIIPDKYKSPDFNNKVYQNQWGQIKKAWKWYDGLGNWIYCTAVYIRNKEKTFIQFIYKKNEWIPEQLKKNKLYNLPEIIENKKAVVILDDEISIDILNKTNKEDFTFTTWTGDISIINKTDWSILKDRKTYYFSSSWSISKQVIYFLREKLNNLIIVDPIVDRAGWNIADDFRNLNLGRKEIKGYITNLTLTENEKKELTVIENKLNARPFIDEIEWPFTFLGYDRRYHFFLQHHTGQIYSITKGSISPFDLYELAPLEFWENYFSDQNARNPVVNYRAATNTLIQKSNAMKPFSFDKLRGRGAWLEDGKLLINTGEYIIYEGNKIHVKEFKNNGHIYERLPEKKFNLECDALSENERLKIWKCLKKLSIKSELELFYLLGWCIVSVFCGATEWKSNLWLTGPSGSGKSFVLKCIVSCFIGEFKDFVKGDTTAVGIMQSGPTDSLPVIRDEAEPDPEGIAKIRSMLSLIRSTTSEKENAVVKKGTSNHKGITFSNHRAFLLTSVNPLLTKESDKSRFSVVKMTQNLQYKWEDLQPELLNCFTKEIGEKIRKRTYNNFDVLLKNIEIFKMAVGAILKKQRYGDQIGTLIAGAMLFLDGLEYDYKKAIDVCSKILKQFDIHEDDTTDEIKCLRKIFNSRIKWINYAEKNEEVTLLSLVNMAFGKNDNNNGIEDNKAKTECLKYGIKCDVENNIINIAGNYEWIKGLLKNTEWEYNYSIVLRNLDFIDNKTKTVYFGSYGTMRALVIDADYILRLSDDSIFMEAGF